MFKANRRLFLSRIDVFLLGLVMLANACLSPNLKAETESKPRDAAADETLARLISTLDSEPLAAFTTTDLRLLPEQFMQTHLGKMLENPTYAEGNDTLRTLLDGLAGVNIREMWPDFKKHLAGPAVIALLPGKAEGQNAEPGLRLVFLVLTHSPENADALKALWPKLPPQSNSAVSVLKLQPVAMTELPPREKISAWAASEKWPNGDMGLKMSPVRLGEALDLWFKRGETEPEGLWASSLGRMSHSGVSALNLGISFTGMLFTDELQLTFAPNAEGSFIRVVKTLKEDPKGWERLLGATPGDQDLLLMSKCDFSALGADLPFAAQALERYLRGTRWTRAKGRSDEALDLKRFDFLTQRIEGSFAVAGKPALSGDLRLAVAASMKGNDVEPLRAELLKGLDEMGGEFTTLKDIRTTIGGVAPLGALFQGKGMFGAPLIGLSPGWAWLCSNSGAYQDLTNAFKTGRTAAAMFKAARAEDWHPEDALRLRIDLEKVTKLAYAVWLLGGVNGPAIGAWKVPGALLPQPQVLTGHLGIMRAGVSRRYNILNGYSICALPGVSLLLVSILEEAADTIDNSRLFSQRALALDQPLPVIPDKLPAVPDKEDTQAEKSKQQNK